MSETRGNNGRPSPEWTAWRNMLRRCYDKAATHYDYYGRRGIKVCRRWQRSFASFLSDVGRRPSPAHSLDRYPDPNGNYEPGNVRWATRREQATNRRPRRRKGIIGTKRARRPVTHTVSQNGVVS